MSDSPFFIVDIEKEFAACVRKIGGEVLADRFGPSPPFANADYAFHSDAVIAELKCLERDTRSESTFKDRVNALHRQWEAEGKISRAPSPGIYRVSTKDIPPECGEQIRSILLNRLRSVIKKANRQIRDTKEALAAPDAKGLLLLVNDDDKIFGLDGILYCLNRVLNGSYSSINGVVLLTVNQAVTGPVPPTQARIWMQLLINDAPAPDRSPVGDEFLLRLREGWFNHEATISGSPVISFDRSDEPPDMVSRYRYPE